MQDFIDDDPGYLAWLAANPSGFVLNSYRQPSRAYLMLHRATCRSISTLPTSGSTWTKDYRKICGRREELESYARGNVGGDLHPCGLCL
ncbi:MAG: hypothetical protein JWN00_1501 [Actinomycetia bacterium]|nr:hypothetical protein [Actinomycetes bacterium]